MVRPRKDKFEETSYAFRKGTEHELVQVSIPFWYNVTFKEKIGKYNDGKSIYGTATQIVSNLEHTKDEIIKSFQEKELKVIKFEDFTTKLPNFCERCGRTGVPIIQKKSNYDKRHRSVTQSPTRNNRPDEYRWIYQHKEGKKICIIAIFDVKNFRFNNPKNRTSELAKHFFPRYLEKMKKELDISDFFQKFANTNHA